jgi:hypothetical protein
MTNDPAYALLQLLGTYFIRQNPGIVFKVGQEISYPLQVRDCEISIRQNNELQVSA